MNPWFAEGEVPTAANLNLYRGRDSCVRWHCDDEPLFGGVGTSKLIVSVSFGSHASFKWKGKSCPDGGVCSCCVGHGDILVMDVQCQDEFLHCTDPGLKQERINVSFRWIKRHTASCALRTGAVCWLPTCVQGSSAAVTGGVGVGTFGALWVLLGVLCNGGCWLCLCFPSCLQDSGYGGVPLAGHAHWAKVGGGIICVTQGELSGLHKNVPVVVFKAVGVIPCNATFASH